MFNSQSNPKRQSRTPHSPAQNCRASPHASRSPLWLMSPRQSAPPAPRPHRPPHCPPHSTPPSSPQTHHSCSHVTPQKSHPPPRHPVHFPSSIFLLTPLPTTHSGISVHLLIVRLPDWRAAPYSLLRSSYSSLAQSRSLGSICGVNGGQTRSLFCHTRWRPVASGLLGPGQL